MAEDYSENYQYLSRLLLELGQELRAPMMGLHQLQKNVLADGALNHKTKELMALAIAIAQRASPCLTFHVRDAILAGATRAEVLETIGVAVMMGGGPASVHGSIALEAAKQFEAQGLTDETSRSYGP
jgi:AhpD family alkylhydroperoxidase